MAYSTQELEALAAEIAASEQVEMEQARVLAAQELANLAEMATDWDTEAAWVAELATDPLLLAFTVDWDTRCGAMQGHTQRLAA